MLVDLMSLINIIIYIWFIKVKNIIYKEIYVIIVKIIIYKMIYVMKTIISKMNLKLLVWHVNSMSLNDLNPNILQRDIC